MINAMIDAFFMAVGITFMMFIVMGMVNKFSLKGLRFTIILTYSLLVPFIYFGNQLAQ